MEKLKAFVIGKFIAEFTKRVGIIAGYAAILGLDENNSDVHYAIIILAGAMTAISLGCKAVDFYKQMKKKEEEGEKSNTTLLTSA